MLWDVTFRSAVAQADIEDRQQTGSYWRLAFGLPATGQEVVVATTRPELLPACVALVAHPQDERFRDLFGTEAITPTFGSACRYSRITLPIPPRAPASR